MPRPSLIVVAQMAAIAVVGLGGPWWPMPWWWWVVTGAAAVLMLWSVVLMGRHLRIEPHLAAGAPLLRTGPYRWVRHPMYTALLAAAVALAVAQPTWWRCGGLVALAVVLGCKIRIEERHLLAQVAGYAAYRQRTGAILPRWVR
jgi:protein-S-isoprenylcysteine O-methyltransferase Ste14